MPKTTPKSAKRRKRTRKGQHAAFWKFWQRKPEPEVDCQINEDCGEGRCCHRTRRVCVARKGATECDDGGPVVARPRARDPYPLEWEREPGQEGFNAYARALLRGANLDRSLSCARKGGDRWYQRTVAYLVHPRTPIQRLLVAHQLGTGKTITMLRILDNFFDDPNEIRPRILLFPTETVAENFYRELATQPNRYRDWLRSIPNGRKWPELPEEGEHTAQNMIELEDERRAFVEWARHELHKWTENVGRHQGTGLAAPLRTFSYAQAGAVGGAGSLVKDTILGWPPNRGVHAARYVDRTAGGAPEFPNLLHNAIVLCDEAHNLLWSEAGVSPDVERCRRRLFNTKGSVVVFFTATPVAGGRTALQDARRMLDLVKGSEYRGMADEGFVSWYMDRPTSLFARVPSATQHMRGGKHTFGIAGAAPRAALARLPNVFPVPIDTAITRNLWQNYVSERFGEGRAPAPGPQRVVPAARRRPKQVQAREQRRAPAAAAPPKRARRPRNAAFDVDVDGFFRRPTAAEKKDRRCLDQPESCKDSWTIDENLLVQRDAMGDMTLQEAAEVAPKLAAIAQSILDLRLKTLVILSSKLGAEKLTRLLVKLDVPVVYLCNTEHLPPKEQKILRAENAIRLHAFNHRDNRHGQRYRVAIAEAEEYSEGVSFMHVRRIVIDQGYGLQVSWANMEQKIGRALRSCSHEDLPANLRSLRVDLYVVVHTQTDRYPPTIDLEKYLFIENEIPLIEKGLDFLRLRSIDAAYYGGQEG